MIDLGTREWVRRRAGRRCEYCHLHENDDPLFTFHVEHIIARQHEELQLTSRRGTCGDAVFEGKVARRTIDGDIEERVRLRVTPKGQYTINFEPGNKEAKK